MYTHTLITNICTYKACVHAQLLQSCLTLCNLMDCSLSGSRQEYWSGLPYSLPWDLPDPGIKIVSSATPSMQVGSLPLSHQGNLYIQWNSSKTETESQIQKTNQWLPLGASLVAQLVKNFPAMQENWVQSLSWEDLLEKKMAPHSSILAWRIPWTEKSGGLQSTGSQRVGHKQLTLSLFSRERGVERGKIGV